MIRVLTWLTADGFCWQVLNNRHAAGPFPELSILPDFRSISQSLISEERPRSRENRQRGNDLNELPAASKDFGDTLKLERLKKRKRNIIFSLWELARQ